MHVCNVILNWLLIFGHLGLPALGATGAGIGTTISTYVGTAIYIGLALRHARPLGFLRSRVDRSTVATMLRLSVPAGLQSFFFAAGMTAFFWIIGRIGTPELAASNVLVQLLLVAILPGVGFGMAAASLVGQALGRGDRDDAVRWGWDVVRLGDGPGRRRGPGRSGVSRSPARSVSARRSTRSRSPAFRCGCSAPR